MLNMAKRNIKVFFRDRSSVFFSLLAVFIIIALYAVFLGDTITSGNENVPGIDNLVNSWVWLLYTSPNCGLSDIVQALRWVYENISAFGGDPESITVLGQSAGAIAASVLPVMPAAKKYVSRVIMMSGGPTLLYTREEYQNVAKQFMKFMGISSAQELLSIPAARLVGSQKKFASHCGLGDGTFMIEVDGGLVPEYPIPAAAQGLSLIHISSN